MTPASRARAEWVTFAASVVIVLALVAVIVALWVGGQSPARVVVREEGVRRSGDEYLVDAVVTNEGEATAANVQVVAVLTLDGETTEGEQAVDFLAGDQEARLVFVFPTDPTRGDLELTVASFADP